MLLQLNRSWPQESGPLGYVNNKNIKLELTARTTSSPLHCIAFRHWQTVSSGFLEQSNSSLPLAYAWSSHLRHCNTWPGVRWAKQQFCSFMISAGVFFELVTSYTLLNSCLRSFWRQIPTLHTISSGVFFPMAGCAPLHVSTRGGTANGLMWALRKIDDAQKPRLGCQNIGNSNENCSEAHWDWGQMQWGVYLLVHY